MHICIILSNIQQIRQIDIRRIDRDPLYHPVRKNEWMTNDSLLLLFQSSICTYTIPKAAHATNLSITGRRWPKYDKTSCIDRHVHNFFSFILSLILSFFLLYFLFIVTLNSFTHSIIPPHRAGRLFSFN